MFPSDRPIGDRASDPGALNLRGVTPEDLEGAAIIRTTKRRTPTGDDFGLRHEKVGVSVGMCRDGKTAIGLTFGESGGGRTVVGLTIQCAESLVDQLITMGVPGNVIICGVCRTRHTRTQACPMPKIGCDECGDVLGTNPTGCSTCEESYQAARAEHDAGEGR